MNLVENVLNGGDNRVIENEDDGMYNGAEYAQEDGEQINYVVQSVLYVDRQLD